MGEPKTMEELLSAYGGGLKSIERGDIVEGTVIDIDQNKVVFDIGWKSEGLVAESAYNEARDFIKTLKKGDKVKARVIVPETSDGYVILTLRETAAQAVWGKLQEAYDKEEPVKVFVKNVGSSGATVDVFGLNGFIPGSHMGKDMTKLGDKAEGTTVEAIIIELDRESNRIVLSEKFVSEKELVEKEKKAIKKIEEGEVYDGEVTTVADFGAFVTIFVEIGKEKIGVDGLVHISELSWDKVEEAQDEVAEGDKVKVKVIGKSNGKLSLSVKQAQKDPWDEIEEKYPADTKVTGKVTKASDFGYFVQLEPGVEGLLHLTKIPPGQKIKAGDEVDVYVEEIDKKERRISLGLVVKTKTTIYK